MSNASSPAVHDEVERFLVNSNAPVAFVGLMREQKRKGEAKYGGVCRVSTPGRGKPFDLEALEELADSMVYLTWEIMRIELDHRQSERARMLMIARTNILTSVRILYTQLGR